MSVAAIKIVEEEVAKLLEDMPSKQSILEAVRQSIVERLAVELVEIPEETIREKYSHLEDSEFPDCHFCKKEAAFEGWIGEGHCIRTFVCPDHKDKLRGAQNESD